MRRSFVSPWLLLLLFTALPCAAQKTAPDPGSQAMFTNGCIDSTAINAVRLCFSNTGLFGCYPWPTRCEWPAGSGKNLLFNDGLVFAGEIGGAARAGGASLLSGMQPGGMISGGAAGDPGDSSYRIYRVRSAIGASFDSLPEAERARLRRDFLEWPARDGAPWVDRDLDGVYEPDFDDWLRRGAASVSDIPRLVGDEMFWFVMNDMDSAKTARFLGTPPIGIEEHTQLWSYAASGVLRNTVFIQHTLINKGRDTLRDFHVGRWSDIDIGDIARGGSNDDIAGIDTTLDLAYTANGNALDDAYGTPPAAGFVLLQGPAYPSPGGTARIGFREREGCRNHRLTSLLAPHGDWLEQPELGKSIASPQMLLLLHGRGGVNYNPSVDPTTGAITTCEYAGDPVRRTGWVFDGVPGWSIISDYRIIPSSGPVTFLPGDTLVVVYALTAAQGAAALESVDALRRSARELHAFWAALPQVRSIPEVSVTPSYPPLRVQVTASIPSATEAWCMLRDSNGTISTQFQLLDDGKHGDGAAGDRVYGATCEAGLSINGAACTVWARYPDGEAVWPGPVGIPMSGRASAVLHAVESDDRNFNHEANPGEDIRLSVRVDNDTEYGIEGWTLHENGFPPKTPMRVFLPDAIPAGGSAVRSYDSSDGDTYFSFDVPSTAGDGDVLPLPVLIRDAHGNRWSDTLRVTVHAMPFPAIDSPMVHAAGPCTGTLHWRVADPAALLDHTYRVTVKGDDDGRKSLVIADLTASEVKCAGSELPTEHGHEFPLIDGWKPVLGTSNAEKFSDDYGRLHHQSNPLLRYIPEAHAWMQDATGYGFMFGGAFMGSRFPWMSTFPVRLVFDRAHASKSYMYLRGGSPSYGCVGYVEVPLRAFDVSDPMRPRQLNTAFVENAGGPSNDSTWMPTTDRMDREYLYIFASAYSDVPSPEYTGRIISNNADSMDIVYAAWVVRRDSTATFTDGDTLVITPIIPISRRDTFLVNPLGRASASPAPCTLPRTLQLGPAFPNPFGASSPSRSDVAEIRYVLPERGRIRLEAIDLLGRCVAVLADADMDAGAHAALFRPPPRLAGGVYLLSLTAAGQHSSSPIIFLK